MLPAPKPLERPVVLIELFWIWQAKFLIKPNVGKVNTNASAGQILVNGVELFWDSPATAEGDDTSSSETGLEDDVSNGGKIPLLASVDFQVKPGELCVVIGRTGAGKSGLMSALIGDLPVDQGVVALNGSVAFAAQTPWIQVSGVAPCLP